MTDTTEVVITSDGSGQLWNACVWDPNNGTSLMYYKGGGVSAPHTLCLLGNDYLLSADNARPLIHAWPLNSQETINLGTGRMLCSGCVNALAVSPNAQYCAAGIAERLHIWQIASGRLMAVSNRHFQDITCLKFTDDGTHIATGGEDCRVIVWPLAYLISQFANEMYSVPGEAEPRYTFFDHSLPVKDVFIGPGGMRALLVSVSFDRTCKIYDLASGKLLLSLLFDAPLTAVTVDGTDSVVFVGTNSGKIQEFNISHPPRDVHHVVNETPKKFVGHDKMITCLSSSIGGQTLLSSSTDMKVIVWDIPSGQCKRVLQHKGPVYNAFFTICPKQMFIEDWKPTVVLNGFQKSVDSESKCIEIMNKVDLCESPTLFDAVPMVAVAEAGSIKDEVIALKKINKDLYTFAINKLLDTASLESSTGNNGDSLNRGIKKKSVKRRRQDEK
ncbi:WD repeat-containing protein 18 [Schistocerca nitens]|uniref:WD repeat-containing protein 18 n=1 Tax=Schistocerca nitens TaxID=7011 RepID=UPI002117F42F|nr:WD repeat-containing protein 18 [Schistocerca nitens]